MLVIFEYWDFSNWFYSSLVHFYAYSKYSDSSSIIEIPRQQKEMRQVFQHAGYDNSQ